MDDARHAMGGRATNCAGEHAGEIAHVADNFGSGQAG
jgi:hypothetical protein